MGLTKQYLRYAAAGNFNIIASARCNVAFVTLDGQEGRFVAVAGCEHILVWDLRLGEKRQVLIGEKTEVTCLCASPDNIHLAAGYSDGTIQVFNLNTGDVATVYSGHRSAISTLSYDLSGHRLASGSIDTEIIVWDTVAEAGQCRLSGHKGIVTTVSFMTNHDILISSSKDTYVKFWDLETKRCFKTLAGHRTEIWALALMKNDKYLITGSIDSQLTVWKISEKGEEDIENRFNNLAIEIEDNEEIEDNTCPLLCTKVGVIMRSGRGRVVSLVPDKTGKILACHGVDNTLDTFCFLDDDEAENRLKKRKKSHAKKLSKESSEKMDVDEDKPNENEDVAIELGLKDEIKKLFSLRVDHKIKSVDAILGKAGELRTAMVLANNTIEMYKSIITEKQSEPSLLRAITSHGHHSEVRAICFSSDNLAVATGSADSVKVWNRPSQACLQTVETGYVLCLCFVPGDRHLLVGLKSGTLLVVDISAGDVLEEIPAHSKELWSISLLPNMRGPVTGGGDNTVKFWNFELIQPDLGENNENRAKVLSLLHTKTLKLEESVLCVRISPNGKFIAVALLDSTVKLFFVDSFKFYISLYGHKLPVLCMDISSDSTLIATGSADRNIKIWGIDFGDCHRSIFAHDDSVTGLQFIQGTHQFFTSGKDGKIKHWDGDSFDKILTLPGHVGDSYSLAVSPAGTHVVSCGSDRVIRLYERTEETLVLQDAAEEERQAAEDATLATGEESGVQGLPGINLPSRKTVGSEKGAESILECLEVSASYQQELDEHELIMKKSNQDIPVPQPPPLMLAYKVSTPQEFLLDTIKRIRSSDLIETLLILPFSAVTEILKMLTTMFNGSDIELLCKLTIFLIKIHHAPIVSNQTLLSVIRKLEKKLMKHMTELRDIVGYNLHGLQYIQRELENSEGILLFRDATKERNHQTKKRKHRERAKRAFVMLGT